MKFLNHKKIYNLILSVFLLSLFVGFGSVHAQEPGSNPQTDVELETGDPTPLLVTVTWDQSSVKIVRDDPNSDDWYFTLKSLGQVNRTLDQDVYLTFSDTGPTGVKTSFRACTFTAGSVGLNFNVSYPECSGPDRAPIVPNHTYAAYFTDVQNNIINSDQGQGELPLPTLESIPEYNQINDNSFSMVAEKQKITKGEYFQITVTSNENLNKEVGIELQRTDAGGINQPSTPLGTVMLDGTTHIVPATAPTQGLPDGNYNVVAVLNGQPIKITDAGSISSTSPSSSSSSSGSGGNFSQILNVDIGGSLVPDCGYNIKTLSNPDGTGRICGLNDVMTLVKKIIDYIFVLILPIAAIVFAYVGFLYLTSGANSANRTKAKKAMGNLVLGILVILSAWLLIKTLLVALNVDSNITDQFIDLNS